MKQILLLSTIILASFIHFQATEATQTDPPIEQNVTLYPNPAKDHFMFNSENFKVSKIFVYNIIGKKVKEFLTPMENERLDIDDLNQGLYLIEVYNENGKIHTVQRLKKM